MIIPIL